ncbi:MAG: trigger factor [Selenomonadaceae bacterium]|nr:trigger factor [Selenomonadaceae bacterium]
MKLTQKKIDDYTIELTVTEAAEEFSKAIKHAAKVLSERVTIRGFRKGSNIPAKILEAHLGKGAIVNEASEILLQNASRKAFGILNLRPVTEPKAEVVTNEEGKDFVFTLTFTPYPQATLGQYKNLFAEKVVEPVTDEDVDKQLEDMRAHHANLIDAAEGDSIVNGDFITLDYTGTVNGEKFAGGEAKDAPLEIGAHKFIGDFEEQLIGLKVGEERTVKVTFPDNYHAKDLAGRDAEFACKINSIKHRELPALDDDFAKKVSTFQTLDEYKADIRKNMEANAARRADENQRQAVLDKAVENMTVDVPPVMIENRITQMINELDAQLRSQGMNLQQYMAFSGLDMDKMREDYREAAKQNVLTDIMLEKVAAAEKISVTEEELNIEIEMMSRLYRTPPKQIVKFLQSNGQLESVVATILRRKTIKFIFDNMATDEAASQEAAAPAQEDKLPQPEATPVKPETAPAKPEPEKVPVEAADEK